MISKKLHPNFLFARFLRNFNWSLLLILAVMGVFGKRGLLDLKRMENENTRLDESLSLLQQEKTSLTSQIRSLQKDKQAQEHTIRRVLGYIRPDEIVIEF